MEGDDVGGALDLAVFQLRLGDGRLEVDVPEDGRLVGVGLSTFEIVEECSLRGPPAEGVDGGVRL